MQAVWGLAFGVRGSAAQDIGGAVRRFAGASHL